ncbi:MAG: TIGR04086 family membrane protein [Clostridia bacterium]|nr:TIGR04086 family membrane protein [Clostridia bacterium]
MRNERVYGNGFFTVLKGVFASLVISFVGTVVFAVILEGGKIGDKAVYPVTQTIKHLSLAIGVLLFIRGEKGWLKGGGAGLMFAALSYLAFSFLGGDFSLGWLVILELMISFVIGALSGCIAVNLKRA